MTVVFRGVVAAAFFIVFIGVGQVAGPAVYAAPETHVSCAKVNDVGDCVPDTPDVVDGGGNSCVLINELGACEDQQEVDDPAHTMVK